MQIPGRQPEAVVVLVALRVQVLQLGVAAVQCEVGQVSARLGVRRRLAQNW